MNKRKKKKSTSKGPARSYQRYESEKAQITPEATPKQYQREIRRLTRKLGI